MHESPAPSRPWLPYVAPFAAFLILTTLEGQLPRSSDGNPHPTWYPLAYAVKIALVAVVAWACRSTWRDLWPRPNVLALTLAVVLGLLVTVVWVGLDGRYPPIPGLGTRQAFNPLKALPPAARVGFVIVRLVGMVLVVPLIEELFWRSFLMRWIINPDFLKVPIGMVTPAAAGVTSVLFALEHPEWLPALLTGFAWAGLLWKTRSVSACVVSHAVANLGLGLYVLATGEWKFL
jgi:CAAX prenyl protease-like protein